MIDPLIEGQLSSGQLHPYNIGQIAVVVEPQGSDRRLSSNIPQNIDIFIFSDINESNNFTDIEK